METNSQKILISLPRTLLAAVDAVKDEQCVSRSAFIRESLRRNIHYYENYERGRVGWQLDGPEINCEGPSQNRDESCEKACQPCFEDDQAP